MVEKRHKIWYCMASVISGTVWAIIARIRSAIALPAPLCAFMYASMSKCFSGMAVDTWSHLQVNVAQTASSRARIRVPSSGAMNRACQAVADITHSDRNSSSNLKQFQPPREVIGLVLMLFKKPIGFLDDPRLDHGFAVDP